METLYREVFSYKLLEYASAYVIYWNYTGFLIIRIKILYGVYKHKDCPAYYIAPLTKDQIRKAIFEENKKKNRKVKF